MKKFLYLGGAFAATCGIITGNHYYVNFKWQNSHPLIQQSLELASKDQTISKVLGKDIQKTGKISGVLTTSKNWSNFSFDIQGTNGIGKLTLLAQITDDPLVKAQPKQQSTYEYLLTQAGLSSNTLQKPVYWRILSLHINLSDKQNRTLIGDDVRTHEELRKIGWIDSNDSQGIVKKISNKGIAQKRREKNMAKVKKLWIIGGLTGLGLLLAWLGLKKYFVVRPVGRSLFFSNAIEIIKMDPNVRKEIGVPINYMQNVKGRMNYGMTKGEAEGIIYGPLGFGRFMVEGKYDKKQKKWKYNVFSIIKGEKSIQVMTDW